MLVKEILNNKQKKVVTATAETSVKTAMELLLTNRISCLPVVDDSQQLVGIISDKDIFKKVYETPVDYRDIKVDQLMTVDVIVGLPGDEMSYIAGLMTNNRIRHIPIVEKNQLLGIVSVGDIVKTQMEHIEIENRYLKQYLASSYPGK